MCSSDLSQAIKTDTSQIATERSLKARAIRDKYKTELEGFVEKYHTKISASMNLDTKHLVMAMAEAILDPDAGTTSYRVLEYVVDMSKVPAIDKCNIFQVFGDMLKDEVMRISITFKKLETKHAQVRENFRREQVNSRALVNQVHSLQDSIKGKETSEADPQCNLINELQKEVASLKCQISIPASHHVQTTE